MIDIDKVYTSNNYGDFRIVKYSNCTNIDIEFINTGYRVETDSSRVLNGSIKDLMSPIVFGVGFLGVGKYRNSIDYKTTKEYNTWSSMLSRCYCPKVHKRYPTYAECTVSPEWLNFQVFAEWFSINYKNGYELDKDVKKEGNKHYSPETCLFLTPKENIIKAKAKSFSFISPSGVITDIYNLSEFCKGKDINKSHMSQVHNGNSPQHKGWTKA